MMERVRRTPLAPGDWNYNCIGPVDALVDLALGTGVESLAGRNRRRHHGADRGDAALGTGRRGLREGRACGVGLTPTRPLPSVVVSKSA